MSEPTSPPGAIMGERTVLTAREAGRYFSVDSGTIRKWASEGFLRGFRTPGGHWRFDEEDILRVLNEHLEGPWS